MRARRTMLIALVVVAATGVACGRQGATSTAPVDPSPSVYEVRGTVVSLDAARRIVELDHEAIPGFMPAMTMPYEVADVALLQGLAQGDRVRGTLRVDRSGYIITSLQKI